jgi:dihydroorotase
LPRNEGHIVLRKRSWQVPDTYAFGVETIVPMRAGAALRWQMESA